MRTKNLIKMGIGLGVGLTLLAAVACEQPSEKTNIVDQQTPKSTITVSPHSPTLEQITNWSFLERKIDTKTQPPDFVINNYIQLDPEITWLPGTGQYETTINSLIQTLEEQLSKRGFNLSEVSFTMTEQLYALPEPQEFAIELKKYCKLAEDFLHQELKGLDKPNIEWTVINPNDNYTNGFKGRGFIGKSLYDIKRIKVNKDGTTLFMLVSVDHSVGGTGKILEDNSFYFFISSNPSALVTPFSEILPLTTSNKTVEYTKEVGGLYAYRAHEALTEAMALSLAGRVSKKLSVPNGEKLVEDGCVT